MALMQPFVPALLPVELDQAAAMAQHQLLGKGITTVTDMGTSQTDWNSLRRLGDAGRLQMRVIAYADDIDTLLAVAGPKKTPWLYGDRLRMVGVNIGLDGALGSRGGWLKQSYADAPGNTGLRLVADTRLRNIYSRASMDGFQVAIDAIGDAANAEALDVIDEMAPTYTGDRRWRIEHAQVIDPADLPRFGRNGIIASMQPVHEVSDRAMVSARLGQARLSGAYAWQSIAKAGGRLAFGSDTPVEPADMMPGFAAALGRDGPERLTPAQTLAGFTSGAAYAGFADDRIGRLLPGYHADFVLLDGDPMTLPPNVVRSIKVLETWIDGKRVWSKAPGGK
jgi:predicted amidohydrolase YtcJ